MSHCQTKCTKGEKYHEENHICRIIVQGDLAKIKTLVVDPKFVCKNCGRASHSADNICKPTKL